MERNKIIRQNVSLSLIFKALNLSIVYLTIPFLLKFLGKENYGVWVTVFSVVSILFFLDGGIANGLKTKLSKALSAKNYLISKEYIATSYIFIFAVSTLFFCIGFLFLHSLNLSSLLNISSEIKETTLKDLFLITLIFVVTNFILSLYKTLFYAAQKAAVIEISVFVYQLLVFGFIYYASNYLTSSLHYVAIVYGLANAVIGLLFSIIFFKNNMKLLPSFSHFKIERLKEIFGLSINFFIIQLCMIIIFTSDNVLISNLLGPEEVANYDIVFKLFQVLITFSIIILEPFWALFSDAYQKNDYSWIKKSLKRLNKLFLFLILGVVLLAFLAESIINLWVGNIISVNDLLIYSMAIFVLIRIYGAIYMFFLNGIGAIKLQTRLYVFGAIINIPLSILFVKHYNLGSSGIILGTIISILAITIFLPIQSYKILKNS